MDLFVDLKVPAVGGSQWTTAERQREKKSLCGNDLQTLLDFCGSPQNDAVERVEGIEPSSEAWEATVLPLNYTRSERLTLYQMFAGICKFFFKNVWVTCLWEQASQLPTSVQMAKACCD